MSSQILWIINTVVLRLGNTEKVAGTKIKFVFREEGSPVSGPSFFE